MLELLSSDILERKFGPTELKVLWWSKDKMERIICTRAVSSGQILELSRVAFNGLGIAAFPDIHQEVVRSASMGKAFRARGVDFKRPGPAYEYDQRALPGSFAERFGTDGPATVVDASILVGPESTPYAGTLEVYSPDVDWPDDTGTAGEAITARINAFSELLAVSDGS